MSVVIALAGLLPAVGLWTPISAGATALLEFWTGFTTGIGRDAHLLAATIALSPTVLGPGAWSLDARLGRRRISIQG